MAWTPFQKPDGHWSADGLGASQTIEFLDFMERLILPHNMSYVKTSNTQQCIDRLVSNESDLVNNDIPMETISPHYHVPLPSLAGKFQFSSGYVMTDGQQHTEETASVLTNVDLLDTQVYLAALALFTCFILLISARVLMHSSKLSIWRKASLIGKEIGRVIHHTSRSFKLINFLSSVLLFYLITSFLCLYKTSHVVIERPFYPKSYQESLEYKTSIAHLVDEISVVSESFENSPPDSIKRKIWMKWKTYGQKNLFSPKKIEPGSMLNFIAFFRTELSRGSLVVVSPLIVHFLRSGTCSISRESELFVIKIFTDSLDREVIFGNPVRKGSILPSRYSSRYRGAFEYHIGDVMWARALDVGDLAAAVMSTSRTHRWRQKVVCENENAFAPETQVHPIPLRYFRSFSNACAWVWLLATLVHTAQCCWCFIQSRLNRLKKQNSLAR